MKDKLIQTFSHWTPDLSGTRQKRIVKVFFESRSDTFYTIVPDHLAETGPIEQSEKRGDAPVTTIRVRDGRIYGATPNEVEKRYGSACYRYEKAITQCRKVIVYQLKFATKDEWGKREDHGGLAFEKGVGLMIDYDIGFEIKVGDKNKHIYRYDPTATTGIICNNYTVGSERHTVIEWTQAREDFFANVTTKIMDMIARSREFLGDGEKLALMIDQGKGGLLLGHDPTPLKRRTP